jgi:hypothetical protein
VISKERVGFDWGIFHLPNISIEAQVRLEMSARLASRFPRVG